MTPISCYSAATMSKTIHILAIIATLLSAGCLKQQPLQLSKQEFLNGYQDLSVTPEGIAKIIDDQNRLAGKTDVTDYAQEYGRNVSDGFTKLLVLEAIDRGDIAKAK